MTEKFPSTEFLQKWIGPAIVAALGVGSLTGAIWYRLDVPVIHTAAGPPSTVVQTVTETPQAAADVRVVRDVVTTTVDRPVPAAAPAAATVTVTKTAEPERVEIEKKVQQPKTVTKTETATETILQAGLRERGNGRDGN